MHENAWSKEISSVFNLGDPDVESIENYIYNLSRGVVRLNSPKCANHLVILG